MNAKEIHRHNVLLNVVDQLANMSHCVSKKVAAIIVKNGRIISTGINGTAAGFTNCDDIFSPDFDPEVHHDWSIKHEIHAEVNAIVMAARNGIAINEADLYVRYSPCTECCKLIVQSGIKRVFFRFKYERDMSGLKLLREGQIETIMMGEIDCAEETN